MGFRKLALDNISTRNAQLCTFFAHLPPSLFDARIPLVWVVLSPTIGCISSYFGNRNLVFSRWPGVWGKFAAQPITIHPHTFFRQNILASSVLSYRMGPCATIKAVLLCSAGRSGTPRLYSGEYSLASLNTTCDLQVIGVWAVIERDVG